MADLEEGLFCDRSIVSIQPNVYSRQEEFTMLDRRQDNKTSQQITEAMRMKRAFGDLAALNLLCLQGVRDDLAREALDGKYERRQRPTRRAQRV